MDKIALVLWLCTWPLVCSIASYLNDRMSAIRGDGFISKDHRAISSLINLVIYVYFIWKL